MNNTFFDFTVYNISDSANFQENISGENKQHILVAFLNEERPELETFLQKILSSIKLDYVKDCLILRGSHFEKMPSFAQLKSQYGCEKALIFGLNAKDLGFNIETPLYNTFSFNNSLFLFADKLSVIENSIERKKILWQNLQSLMV